MALCNDDRARSGGWARGIVPKAAIGLARPMLQTCFYVFPLEGSVSPLPTLLCPPDTTRDRIKLARRALASTSTAGIVQKVSRISGPDLGS